MSAAPLVELLVLDPQTDLNPRPWYSVAVRVGNRATFSACLHAAEVAPLIDAATFTATKGRFHSWDELKAAEVDP